MRIGQEGSPYHVQYGAGGFGQQGGGNMVGEASDRRSRQQAIYRGQASQGVPIRSTLFVRLHAPIINDLEQRRNDIKLPSSRQQGVLQREAVLESRFQKSCLRHGATSPAQRIGWPVGGAGRCALAAVALSESAKFAPLPRLSVWSDCSLRGVPLREPRRRSRFCLGPPEPARRNSRFGA